MTANNGFSPLLLGLMLGAIVFRVGRREYPNIGLNAVLGVLAGIVAWGRFGCGGAKRHPRREKGTY